MKENAIITVVGFVEQTVEGDYLIEFLGDVDFGLIMNSVERIDAVRFVANWPKRRKMFVWITRPIELVRKNFDEVFEKILDVKVRYYKLVE